LHKNCLLQYVIEGKVQGRIQVTGRQGKRSMQLLDNFKEKRGYFKLKEGALDGTLEENSLQKKLWTCLNTDCRINE
jgi:hypothetical protein